MNKYKNLNVFCGNCKWWTGKHDEFSLYGKCKNIKSDKYCRENDMGYGIKTRIDNICNYWKKIIKKKKKENNGTEFLIL